jgi:DNA adenine methylase
MKELRPLIYYGGKIPLIPHLLELIPPHKMYVEVFGGSAALLFAKAPSEVEVYNDIDGELVNFFKVLQDSDKCLEMMRRLSHTLYSRQMYKEAYRALGEGDEITRAVNLFIAINQAFNGIFGAGWSSAKSKRLAGKAARYFGKIDLLPWVHARLRRVAVENLDFREILKRYDKEDTFFYLDPPYLNVRRDDKKNYRFEMSEKDHEDMVGMLLNIKGKALLSGYRNHIYARLEEAGWNVKDIEVPLSSTYLVGLEQRPKAVETLWWNYELEEERGQASIEEWLGE